MTSNLGRSVSIPLNIVNSNIISMSVMVGSGSGNRRIFTTTSFDFIEQMFVVQTTNVSSPSSFDGYRILTNRGAGIISLDSNVASNRVIMAIEIVYT